MARHLQEPLMAACCYHSYLRIICIHLDYNLLCFVSLQDLSSFAMPLLESETNDMATDVDGNFRPRSGSGGIRNFFRKKHKSGDVESMKASASASSTGKPAKSRNFLEAIRPRSKSDVAALQMGRPRTQSVGLPMDTSEVRSRAEQEFVLSKSPSGSVPTPMSALLSGDKSPSKPVPTQKEAAPAPGAVTPEMFVEMYRHRAYSDPRPRTNLRAAASAARAKKVSFFRLFCWAIFWLDNSFERLNFTAAKLLLLRSFQLEEGLDPSQVNSLSLSNCVLINRST